MPFPIWMVVTRFARQGETCACCGKRLSLGNRDRGLRGAWHAHHIDGNRYNDRLSNCAVVCINAPENCHLNVAHQGSYTTGLAPRSYFTLVR